MQLFPQELVDLVLDNVAAASGSTNIGRCGLVCWRWLPCSRKHLFSRITLSNADSAAFHAFQNIVDASCTPVLALVKSLELRLRNGPFSEAHMAQFRDCYALGDLRVHAPRHAYRGSLTPVEDPPFQTWLQTHIPRFHLSLTRFELVLGSDLPLSLIVEIILSLPHLTHLKICGSLFYGFVKSRTVESTHPFPPHLRSVKISISRGSSLFFNWLLSRPQLPVFTTLKLGRLINPDSVAPIEEYTKRVGRKIQSLSFDYSADGTDICHFEDRILALTSQLVHLSLVTSRPKRLASRLACLSSHQLTTMIIEMCPMRPGWECSALDYAAIDAVLGSPNYVLLRQLTFRNRQYFGTPFTTAEVKVLMPHAAARGILD
ncbi:hypothetical protein C8R43DRAFT_1136001 [Mycena crocata]|nr:hypothetical protein C8R43DRAFT_1136001 [Mycena crocata]